MSDQENVLMALYGITSETKSVYAYKEHRYEKLKDALNFARIDAERDQEYSLPTLPAQ